MSRTIKSILTVALALSLVGVLLLGVAFGLGARPEALVESVLSGSWNIVSLGFSSGYRDWDNVYSADGSYSVLAAGINSIDLNWVAGNVRVSAGDGDEILFIEDSDEEIDKAKALRWGVKDGTLYIQYYAPGRYHGFSEKSLHMMIPRTLISALKEFQFDAASGSLIASGLSVGTARLNSISGSIEYEGVFETLRADSASGAMHIVSHGASRSATVSSVSGRIHVSGDIEKLNIDSSSGDVILDGALGKVSNFGEVEVSSISGTVKLTGSILSADIETSSGSVSVEAVNRPNDVDVDTVSGSVTFRLPADSGFSLRYDTVSGTLRSDFPAAQILGGETYTFGDGATKLHVSTASGGLQLASLG